MHNFAMVTWMIRYVTFIKKKKTEKKNNKQVVHVSGQTMYDMRNELYNGKCKEDRNTHAVWMRWMLSLISLMNFPKKINH